MNQVIKFPVIAGVEITTDSEGRFNLNALHKASGLGAEKAPSKWLRNASTKELVCLAESKTGQICIVSTDGRSGGTFAHENLATEYAGWISAEFRWLVNQTFVDYRAGNLKPFPEKLSRMEILQLAMKAEEENQKLLSQVDEMTPKVKALDRIANSDGSLCVTDAAKSLQMRPKDLFQWLNANNWIYRRAGCSHWVGRGEKLKSGYVEHKVTVISRSDGSEKTTEQVRITPKGLVKISGLLDEQSVA